MIGGGASLLPEESEAYLKGNGYGIFKNDIDGMRNYKGNNMWALFGDREMAYDIDRDPNQQPSLEEMTRKAIEKLSQNPNGFFLMVEGSKGANAAAGFKNAFLTESCTSHFFMVSFLSQDSTNGGFHFHRILLFAAAQNICSVIIVLEFKDSGG